MDVLVKYNEGEQTLENVPTEESDFYKTIAQFVTTLPFPNNIVCLVAGRKIEYESMSRGETCNLQERYNGIKFKVAGAFPRKYLTYADYISAEKKALQEKGLTKSGDDRGSYKYYELVPNEDGTFTAKYGSIGGSFVGFGRKDRSYTYPNSMYWIKYYEKVNKGYFDNTEAYVEEDEEPVVTEISEESIKEETPDTSIAMRLFRRLSKKTIELIKRTTTIQKVTQGMIDSSKELMAQLYETETLDEFNQILLKLCMVSPRRVMDMKDLMAKDDESKKIALQREEDLIQAMEGMLLNRKRSNGETIEENPFDLMGVHIMDCTKEDLNLIDTHLPLPADLKSKVHRVYKINDINQSKKFDTYCEKNNITAKKYLWHGSRTENWLSIITTRLKLNPAAKINGKMWGHGIYFAPSAKKSWGYTSYRGSYWAKGTSDAAYMGIYEVAYGNPVFPTTLHSYTQGEVKKLGKDCVHAVAGACGLANDEIIFYDESAMVLRYIVEFV